ncbi:MAG TPA: hypothetical protein VFL16_16520 [Steroidobacteraceae bacterium]|nr:hypothetical protein [Steroidobacteraceae bacterium]
MIESTRRTRGVSRLAVLLTIALALAVLVAWLLLRRGWSAAGSEDAAPGAAPPAGTRQSAAPSASDRGATASTVTPAQDATTSTDPATSGIGFTSAPGPQATAPDAAAASPPAAGGTRDTPDDVARFPRYWRRCFRDPAAQNDYTIESDSSTAWSGSWSVKIAARTDRAHLAGAGLCQSVSAATIRGRRIRITLHMRTLNVAAGAYMLFRAEGADGRLMAFHNGKPRWIAGTRDWSEYSVVLDVPAQATVIVLGGILADTGTLWIDDALIQFVSPDVAATPATPPGVHYNPVIDASTLPKALQNPGFEQLEGGGL